MDMQKAQEMILTGFAYMTKDQRATMLKFLKLSKPNLDFSYPNGVSVEKINTEEPVKPAVSLILPK